MIRKTLERSYVNTRDGVTLEYWSLEVSESVFWRRSGFLVEGLAEELGCKLRRLTSELCVGGNSGRCLAFSGGRWLGVLPLPFSFFFLFFHYFL